MINLIVLLKNFIQKFKLCIMLVKLITLQYIGYNFLEKLDIENNFEVHLNVVIIIFSI